MRGLSDVYSHPLYYDIAFGWDPTPEVEFYLEVFERYAGSVRTVLELGCGTGRLLTEMAARGPYCVGLDVNPEMARFAARRARMLGVQADVVRADMAEFSLSGIDATFSAVNTISALTTDEALASHYASVSRALRRGGVYVIDAALNPSPGDREEWEEKRDGITVRAEWEVVSLLPRGRVLDRLRLVVRERSRSFELLDESPSRRMSPADLSELPRRFGLEPIAWYLSFDLEDEVDSPPERGRVIAVLRRV